MPEYFEDEFVIKSRDGRRKLKFNLGLTNLLDYFFEILPNGKKSEIATKGDILSSQGTTALSGLTTDVQIDAPVTGQILKYDATKWVNAGLNTKDYYTKVSPTNTPVGGLASGTNIANLSLEDIIEKMVVIYLSPTFGSFSFSGMSSPVEVGTTFTGNKTASWGTTNSGNILANTISIQDVTSAGSPYLIQNTANDTANGGTEIVNIGSVQKTTATSHTWRIYGTNTNSVVFTRDTSISWQWKRFYGTSTNTTLNEIQIEAMTGQLASGFSGTYSLGAGGYKYFAWPDSFGSPSVSSPPSLGIIMAGNAVAMADSSDGYTNIQNGWNYQLIPVTNVNNVTTNYRLYRTKNILNDTVTIIIS